MNVHRVSSVLSSRVNSKKHLIEIFISALPYLGFFLGALLWIVDALIDALLINPNETLSDALFTDDLTELWMRCLVIIAFTVSSAIVQYFMRQQNEAERALRYNQQNLEKIILERTLELQRQANFDPLTGIYNRRMFTHLMTQECSKALRQDFSLSVVLCDIDYFKSVNDNYGHEQGDRILVTFANTISEKVRQHDIFARWGGEEFILLLPCTDNDGAIQVAEKLRLEIGNIRYGDIGKSVSASFGVATLRDSENDCSSLIKRADEALYRAKREGRNRVCNSDS